MFFPEGQIQVHLYGMSLHTTFQGMSVPGIAQSSSEIHDALQAEPEGLDAGFAVGLSRKETAKHGY